MAAPVFADIAIMWQRANNRCVLTGDGLSYALDLRDGPRIVRTAPMTDEVTALVSSVSWLREFEKVRSSPKPPAPVRP